MPITKGIVFLLQQVGFVQLLFRAQVSLTIHWGKNSTVFESVEGLWALSQLNAHQGKLFWAIFTSPNHTWKHTHSHYSLHSAKTQMFEMLQTNLLFNADFATFEEACCHLLHLCQRVAFTWTTREKMRSKTHLGINTEDFWSDAHLTYNLVLLVSRVTALRVSDRDL